jgi:hypothetical protein
VYIGNEFQCVKLNEKELTMAKKLTKSQANLLAAIADATKKNENFFIEKNDDTTTLFNAKLILVNPQITNDAGQAAAKATAEGIEAATKAPKSATAVATPSNFAFITNATPPVSKRGGGGGGAPAKYPFADCPINVSFLVGNDEVASGDAYKSLQSSVAAANAEYSEGTGEMETVERTKRGPGNKAELDAAGNKVKETVQREKRKPTRKFIIRKVEAGKKYGEWEAPKTGALITRTL